MTALKAGGSPGECENGQASARRGTALLPIVKEGLIKLLAAIGSKSPLPPERVNRAKIGSILVIRQHDQLGDFLLATPVLQALRDRFPAARIGVLVRDSFSDVLTGHPLVDEILIIPKTTGQWNLRRLRALFRGLVGKWDMAVVLNTVSHSLTSDVLAVLSGSRFVLGSEHRTFGGVRENFFYNLRAPYTTSFRHQTDRNLDIVRYIGADTRNRSEAMYLSPAERKGAEQRLALLGIDRKKPVIALHIGAGKPKNRWPAARFGQLATRIHKELKAQVLVCWGRAEGDLAADFSAHAKFRPFMLPPGDLRALAAAFLQCNLLVCNDTGMLHVGAAAGVPVVAVFGPTDPREWKPIGEKIVAVGSKTGETRDVPVSAVFAAVRKLFATRVRRRSGT